MANPAAIPVFVFSELGDYIAQGNFRPIGRVIEHANFLAVELAMSVTGLPLPAVLGIQRSLSAVLLAGALALIVGVVARFAGAGRAGALVPRVLAMTVFAGFLVAHGAGTALHTFSGMYLQSAALVVLSTALVLRTSLWRPRRVRVREWILYAAAGVVLASINEIGYLAVPAIAAIVLVQILARLPLSPSNLLALPGVRLTGVSAAGFLAVFVPVRIAIQVACGSDEGGCYRASAISLDAWSWRFWLARATAGTPVRGWSALGEPGVDWAWMIAGGVVLAALVAAVLLASRTRETPVADWQEVDLVRREWLLRPDLTLVLIGAVLVVSAALLSSLSEQLQASQSLEGWREAPVAMVGWALVVSGALSAALRRTPAPRTTAVVTSLLVSALVVVAMIANTGVRSADLENRGFVAGDRIAMELSSFRLDPDGDAARCSLLDELEDALQERPADARLIADVVQDYARQHHDADFCAGLAVRE